MAIDTLVAGVHFPWPTLPADIGHKSLAVNLSDLAAMGATPLGGKISLVTPNTDPQWREAFDSGWGALAGEFSLVSDIVSSVSGDLVVTVQVYGELPEHQAVTRSGASRGDIILVTGTLGDAGVGLACALGDITLQTSDSQYLQARLNRPTPRVYEGIALQGNASAAIDVSDGLLADLGHLATASGLGASLDISRLPFSTALRRNFDSHHRVQYALSSGDDYELLFTCPDDIVDGLRARIEALGTSCTAIGTMEKAPGIRGLGGQLDSGGAAGWEHFS